MRSADSTCGGVSDGVVCGTDPDTRYVDICESESCARVLCADTGFNVISDFGSGPISYTYTPFSASGTTPAIDSAVINLAGNFVWSRQTSQPDANGMSTAVYQYGTAFQGVSVIVVTTDGQTVNMNIDGRTVQALPVSQVQNIDPNNLPQIVFDDGNPAPTVTVQDGVLAQIQGIASLAQTSQGICASSAAAAVPVLGGPADTPPFEPGHGSNVFGSSGCSSCNLNCAVAGDACIVGGNLTCDVAAAGLNVVPFLGVALAAACDIGVDIGCVVAQNTCTGNCSNIGSPCCPVACGTNCCNGDETCLNSGASLCCSAGYTPCSGPAQSCVDLTQAVCLPSGAGCPIGTATCGAGVNQICCPSGICSGNTCLPPSRFGITVNLTETQQGPEICTHGTAFTPGAIATVTYTGIPGTSGPVTAGTAAVDANGNFSLTDTSQLGSVITCSTDQAFGGVTIAAQDATVPQGTGATTTANVGAVFWCSNFPSGGGTGIGTCP